MKNNFSKKIKTKRSFINHTEKLMGDFFVWLELVLLLSLFWIHVLISSMRKIGYKKEMYAERKLPNRKKLIRINFIDMCRKLTHNNCTIN